MLTANTPSDPLAVPCPCCNKPQEPYLDPDAVELYCPACTRYAPMEPTTDERTRPHRSRRPAVAAR